MRALLDVDVWVALFDDAHQFSDRADVFIAKKGVKIASWLLVENGAVHVVSSPRYSRRGSPAIQQVRERLREACNELAHSFWPNGVSWREHKILSFARLQGHNQIADMCLLTLATRNSDCSVSFDQSIALSGVHGASQKHLVLL